LRQSDGQELKRREPKLRGSAADIVCGGSRKKRTQSRITESSRKTEKLLGEKGCSKEEGISANKGIEKARKPN